MRILLISFFTFVTVLTQPVFAESGSISGRITDGSAPLEGFMSLYQVGHFSEPLPAQQEFSIATDGRYAFSNIADGSYVLRTSYVERQGNLYVDMMSGNVPCPATRCDLTLATPVAVINGAAVTDLNFVLSLGSVMSGQITGAGKPLTAKQYLTFFTAAGKMITKQPTSDSGAFSLGQLPIGSYYVETTESKKYVDELYNNIPCVNDACDKSQGTLITITQPQTVSTVNFDLNTGGKISGTVILDRTHKGVYRIPITVYDSSNRVVATALTASNGKFLTSTQLPTGTYFVTTSTTAFDNVMYRNGTCPTAACNPLSGTPVKVTAGSVTRNINMTLRQPSSGKKVDLLATWTKPVKSRPYIYTLNVINKGPDNAGTFMVQVYTSPNSTVSGQSKLIKTIRVSDLPRLAARHYNITLQKSSRAKLAIATVDSGKAVSETNEKNNTVTTAITYS